MKNNLIIIFISLIFSYQTSTCCLLVEPDSSTCLVLEGKILNAGAGLEGGYVIEIFCDGVKIDSILLKGKKKRFLCNLEINKSYGVRISKKGFIPRLLSIQTAIKKESEFPYRFKFETSLFEEAKRDSMNLDALDFPIAIITYDESEDAFRHSKEYTDYIKKESKRL